MTTKENGLLRSFLLRLGMHDYESNSAADPDCGACSNSSHCHYFLNDEDVEECWFLDGCVYYQNYEDYDKKGEQQPITESLMV